MSRQIVLKLDKLDHAAVTKAMSIRDRMLSGIPEGGGNLDGRVIAEICRGWMEMLDAAGPEHRFEEEER